MAAIRVEFAHHAVEVDALVLERAERGVTGACQQIGELLGGVDPGPQYDGVAEVADRPLGAGVRLSTGEAIRKSSVAV